MQRSGSGIWALLAASAFVASLQARDLSQQGAPGPPTGQAKAQSTGSGLLMGTIVDPLTDRPVPESLVTLLGRRGGTVTVVLTDSQGRFVFSDLPTNVYTINTSKAGYSDGAFGRRRPGGPEQTLPLADAERLADLKIPIWKDGSISGTIRDDTGEPMVDLPVRAMRRTFVAGRRRLSPYSSVRTDDRGLYRLGSLAPGEYLIVMLSTQTTAPDSVVGLYRQAQAASRTGGPSDVIRDLTSSGAGNLLNFISGSAGSKVDSFSFQSVGWASRASMIPVRSADGRMSVYPTQYYPAAPTAAEATPITLRSGEERSGVDLQLKLAPTARVSGTVMGPDGPAMVGLSLMPNADDFTLDTNLETATTVSDAAGQFTFLGVPPGQYLLRVVKSPPPASRVGPPPPLPASAPTLWATRPISVDTSDLRDVIVTLRTGFRVTGHVEFDNAANQPAPDVIRRIVAIFESADGRQLASSTSRVQFETTSQFASNQLPEGRYCLRVFFPLPGWELKSALVDGRDISNVPLSLDRDVAGVVITFTSRPGQLSGRVHSATGAGDAEATVLIFPAESTSWMDYGANPPRLRSIRTDQDGGYQTSGLPAGDYLVVAIADDAAADWQDPKALQKLARLATAMKLADGETRSLELRTMAVPR